MKVRILECIVISIEDVSMDHYKKTCDFLYDLKVVWVPVVLDFNRNIFSIQANCLNSLQVEKIRTFFNNLNK